MNKPVFNYTLWKLMFSSTTCPDKQHVALTTAWTGYIMCTDMWTDFILASPYNTDDVSLTGWGRSVKNYDLLET